MNEDKKPQRMSIARKDAISAQLDKPLRRILQIDGWRGIPEDDLDREWMDEDQDVIYRQWQNELRNTDFPVRIQIVPPADPVVVIRMLRKILNWIEAQPELLKEPTSAQSAMKKSQNFDF